MREELKCIKFIHLFILLTFLCQSHALLSASSNALLRSMNYESIHPQFYSYLFSAKKKSNSNNNERRIPANWIASDDEILPLEEKNISWIETVMVADSEGVMTAMRKTYESWARQEEIYEQWNFKDYHQSIEDKDKVKRSYVQKNLLLYFDNRLNSEIKKAPEGSTLKQVGKVQTALRPSTQVSFTEDYSLKFKARVLQGFALVNFNNPFVTSYAEILVSGNVNLYVKKNFFEKTATSLQYQVNQGRFVASVARPLADRISVQLTRTQDTKGFSQLFGAHTVHGLGVSFYQNF